MAQEKTVSAKTDFRALDEAQIIAKVAELRRELVEHHRSNAAGEIASPAVISKTRKSIAKLLTILGEKQQAAAKKEEN